MAGNKLELEELKQDVQEAKDLLATATRKRLKDALSLEILKIEKKLKDLTSISDNNSINSEPLQTTTTNSTVRTYTTVIRNYSWDQSDKFLKLYLTLKDVHTLDKEKIVCTFQKRGLDFKALELDGKNHELTIANFAYQIIPDKSYFKVKTDMVVVFAAKSGTTKWEAITFEEQRVLDAKKATKPEANKDDPTSGLMGLMKQMYDDGDDEMKRMLNKTWYESQLKSKGGSPDLPPGMGMGGMGMGGMGMGGMGMGGMDMDL